MAISAQNALKLSAWLAVHEPELFRQLLVTTQKMQASPYGKLGYFGDDAGFLDSFTPDVSSVDVSAATADIPMDTSIGIDNAALDASLYDTLTGGDSTVAAIGVSADTANALNQAIGTASSSDASLPGPAASGFWSAVATGASSVLGAVGKVASALTSPTVLNGAAQATAAYFNSQARNAQTQAQLALAQTQLARVSNGLAPAPITYAVNPQTGQLVPVYAGANGTVPLTSQLAQTLASPSLGGLSTGTVLFGIGALLLVVFMSSSNR